MNGLLFEPVTRISNWGYWDAIGDKILVDGEPIIVSWPDGTTSLEVCRVEDNTRSVMDHGSYCDIPDDRAFVVISWRGATSRLYLHQVNVLCARQR